MSDVTVVELLRHGEPEGGQKFRGAVDDPLSPRGWEQMRAAVGDYRGWQAIVSSPLIRCAAFAHELAERLNCPLEIVQGFSELSFGIWEGRAVAEVNATDPLTLARFWRDPVAYPVPNGEPVADFNGRTWWWPLPGSTCAVGDLRRSDSDVIASLARNAVAGDMAHRCAVRRGQSTSPIS